jgi:hypothetical protein
VSLQRVALATGKINMDSGWVIAACAVLTLAGAILVGTVGVYLEVKKNTMLTKQILRRCEDTEKTVDKLKERIVRIETINGIIPI